MFIPIGDDNSRITTKPWVTWAITLACAYVWYRQLTGGDAFTMAWSATPYEITTGKDLTSPVAVTNNGETAVIPHSPGPYPIQLTLLSSMFLHGSWLHGIGNMAYLLVFADQIEHRLGHWRFILFYIACGLVAGLAQVWSQPESPIPILGASGAIAGALGAYLVTTPRNTVKLLVFLWVVRTPAWFVLSLWIVLQIMALRAMDPAQVTGVAYLAHIGGFIAGAILVYVMTPRKSSR